MVLDRLCGPGGGGDDAAVSGGAAVASWLPPLLVSPHPRRFLTKSRYTHGRVPRQSMCSRFCSSSPQRSPLPSGFTRSVIARISSDLPPRRSAASRSRRPRRSFVPAVVAREPWAPSDRGRRVSVRVRGMGCSIDVREGAAPLSPDVAARVGASDIAVDSVARIAAAQQIPPAQARDAAVRDALWAAEARCSRPRTGAPTCGARSACCSPVACSTA